MSWKRLSIFMVVRTPLESRIHHDLLRYPSVADASPSGRAYLKLVLLAAAIGIPAATSPKAGFASRFRMANIPN